MSSPENFDSLEKLLKLKRYEQPPPRYFRDFSGRVISRIEAGEARNSWWERFGFDLRPAFAAAAGMFACGLVVYGVATADGGVEISNDAAGVSSDALIAQTARTAASSTNPVVSSGTPIDRKVFGGAQVLSASFSP